MDDNRLRRCVILTVRPINYARRCRLENHDPGKAWQRLKQLIVDPHGKILGSRPRWNHIVEIVMVEALYQWFHCFRNFGIVDHKPSRVRFARTLHAEAVRMPVKAGAFMIWTQVRK